MERTKVIGGLCFFAVIFGIIVYFTLLGYLPTFEMIKEERMVIEAILMERPALGILVFGASYIAAVALSVPVATLLTVLSGFLFGPIVGTIVVVFAATIGASIIFILTRYFFGEYFTQKFGARLTPVNNELHDHGFKDALLLRLAPVIPFSLINIALALSSISFKHYVAATFIGIAPFSFIYVLAGDRLSEIGSLREVLSYEVVILISLIALSVLIPRFIRRRRSIDAVRTERPVHLPHQE